MSAGTSTAPAVHADWCHMSAASQLTVGAATAAADAIIYLSMGSRRYSFRRRHRRNLGKVSCRCSGPAPLDGAGIGQDC